MKTVRIMKGRPYYFNCRECPEPLWTEEERASGRHAECARVMEFKITEREPELEEVEKAALLDFLAREPER